MDGYKDIIELIAKRQLGILGKRKTVEIFGDAGLALGDDEKLGSDSAGYDELEKLANKLHQKYGPVPIMGCKIPVARRAKELKLKLPDLFV